MSDNIQILITSKIHIKTQAEHFSLNKSKEMNFFIFFALALVPCIKSDESIDPKYISTIPITSEDLIGPWYLLYWGSPQSDSYFPEDLKCDYLWRTYINETFAASTNNLIVG